MDAGQFFLLEHARAHSGEMTKGDGALHTSGALLGSIADSVLTGLTDDQLRLCPHGLNSITWLLWHIARTEDVVVNVVIADRRQVFNEEEWASRLNVSRRDIGTEMTGEEVAELSSRVNVPAIHAYRDAVGRRTRDIVRSLEADEWEKVPGLSRIRAARSQEAFRSELSFPEKTWGIATVARLLSWPGLGHSIWHLSQAKWVRKLLIRDFS